MTAIQLQKKKPHWLKQIISGILILGSMVGWVYAHIYLSIFVHNNKDSFITSPFFSLSFTSIFSFLLFMWVIGIVRSKELPPFTKNTFFKIILPSILFITFYILSFDNYLSIGKQKITFSPYWSLGIQKEYTWDDIEYVTIAANDGNSKSPVGHYYITFRDGNYIDIWETRAGRPENISYIDNFIRERGIERYIKSVPSKKRINNKYKDKNDREIIYHLFSN